MGTTAGSSRRLTGADEGREDDSLGVMTRHTDEGKEDDGRLQSGEIFANKKGSHVGRARCRYREARRDTGDVGEATLSVSQGRHSPLQK